MPGARSCPIPRHVAGIVGAAIFVSGLGFGDVASAQIPQNPQPDDRIMMANRIKLTESVTWQEIRLTFLPRPATPQYPVYLRLYDVSFDSPFRCEEMVPNQAYLLDLLVAQELHLDLLPVQPAEAHWIGMPPQDEIWLTWNFVDDVHLIPERTYLVGIDAARADWVGLRVVPEAHEVDSNDETSVVSFDQGESWICLDNAAIWAIIGKQIEPNCSPLLQVEIEPDA